MKHVCIQCGIDCERPSQCSRCKSVVYCGPACQKSHWKAGADTKALPFLLTFLLPSPLLQQLLHVRISDTLAHVHICDSGHKAECIAPRVQPVAGTGETSAGGREAPIASEVSLYVYDLSRGFAKRMSQTLLGKQIDGVWHTSIVVFGKEFFYGGGIQSGEPGQTPYGTPVERVSLGETTKNLDHLLKFFEVRSQKFSPSGYHLLDNNCNHFSNECSVFLTVSDDEHEWTYRCVACERVQRP